MSDLSSSLRLCLYQAEILQNQRDANLGRFEEEISEHFGARTDLPDVLIFPEMFPTGFGVGAEQAEYKGHHVRKWMQQIADRYDCLVMGSAAVSDNTGAGAALFNRLFYVFPQQANHSDASYDKIKLFPIGKEKETFSGGAERKIMSWRGWNLLGLVCYDLRFPELAMNHFRSPDDLDGEYELLIYVANWPVERIFAWNTLLPARAIENRAYTVGVNRFGETDSLQYPGCSAVYDYMGKALGSMEARAGIIEVEIAKTKLREFRAAHPFV
jgi:predicted amidohydrolase